MGNPLGPDATFRDGLSKGQINLQQCGNCDQFIFFPRINCPHCGGTSLTWHPASGKGEVHTATTVRRRAEKGGDYNVSMIELAEGVRMMSRVDGIAPLDVKIGLAITAFAGEIDGIPAVLCKPAEG
ncbi:MAG: OB-fold domain-containing protein [Rhodobacteraceae bacterium]|nr:OB-fold domain-containing protein [Paracoccaceae bacterium]